MLLATPRNTKYFSFFLATSAFLFFVLFVFFSMYVNVFSVSITVKFIIFIGKYKIFSKFS